MSTPDDGRFEIAHHCWNSGRALEAGRLVAETIPPDVRAEWAAGILRLVLDKSGRRFPLFERVCEIATDSQRWHEAHRTFSEIRTHTVRSPER